MSERALPQFRLLHLFVALFVVAGLLGAVQNGIWLAISLWLPVSLLAWSICRSAESRGRLHFENWYFALPVVVLVLYAVLRFILVEAQSGMLLLGWNTWGLWIALKYDDMRAKAGQLIPTGLVLACLVVAYSPWQAPAWRAVGGGRLVDVSGGRRGVELLGVGLGWAGPETALIESYLGSTPATWLIEGPYSASPLQGGLGKCLAMLPDEEARREVVKALADPDNVLSIHQAMMLVALERLGYPPGLDAQSWWRVHAPIFQVVDDEDRGAWITGGFKHRWVWIFQRDYCDDREIARIVDAVEDIEDHHWSILRSYGGPTSFNDPPPTVVWWPAKTSRDPHHVPAPE